MQPTLVRHSQQLPATLLQFFNVWKPRTPGLRHKRLVKTDDLYQGAPIPSLLTKLHKTGGRCRDTGRITARHRGGGEKHSYRLMDWDRSNEGAHEVMRVEVDPNRSARIALLKHLESNMLSYIVAPKGVIPGQVLHNGESVAPDIGNCLPLSAIPPGTLIHNIGLKNGEAGKIARSAGTYAQLLRTGQKGLAQIKMCSGEIRFIPVGAKATIGTVSNPFHKLEILGTAGANRRRGKRPSVRGVAQNPVDHPMGGRGRGRGMPSTSPWGKITKGVFTVKKHLNPMIIKARPTVNARKKQPVKKTGIFALSNQSIIVPDLEAPSQKQE
ncbi:hypothetical protein MP228_009724 [Amoeboaphelidium protococcarum]|nr:hypothetical protein MP228_009724 [Amoeboaphelidium protococcarum]